MHEVKLDKDLKPLARQFNLKLLRNKDKNMHVRAISSTLIEKGLVSVTTNLNNVSREDVTVKGWNFITDKFIGDSGLSCLPLKTPGLWFLMFQGRMASEGFETFSQLTKW